MPKSAKFARSIQLLKVSLEVIRKNKKLLFFPLVNFVFMGCILGVFFSYLFITYDFGNIIMGAGTTPSQIDRAAIIGGFYTLYIISMFCATFFNVALCHEIIKTMAGKQSSIRQGLAFSLHRIRTILVWSLFASSIGIVIQLLSERLGFIGKFVLRIIGLTWSVAATLAVPVIVRSESANPVFLLKNSAAMIKKTWGELLIAYVGVELPSVALVFVFILAIFVVAFLLAMGVSILVAWAGFALALVAKSEVISIAKFVYLFISTLLPIITLVTLLFVVRMANSVFLCALYVYASEGVVPAPYSVDMMDAAWKVKKR